LKEELKDNQRSKQEFDSLKSKIEKLENSLKESKKKIEKKTIEKTQNLYQELKSNFEETKQKVNRR
jgi:hypothetical protein